MFTLHDGKPGLICQRRDFLRVGAGLAVGGFSIAPFAEHTAAAASSGNARSCILVYLLGGPPQLDTFDLKPDAPAEYRGPFQPIATGVPGLQICEHLPRLARIADHYALIRSVTQRNSNHTPMIYYTLTGRHTAFPDRDNDIRPPLREDFPHMGSVLARFRPSPPELPGYIAIPELGIRSSTSGEFKRVRSPLRGGNAGFLGAKYDPLIVDGEPGTAGAVPALALPDEVTAQRFESRSALLSILDQRTRAQRETRSSRALQDQAVILTGSASRGKLRPFALETEPSEVRDRYGRHRFGQTMLLARRLAEAGVPMIAIHFNEMTICDGWDTHSKNFEGCQNELLPMLDQSLSALLEDLRQRDLLDQTLVACLGEFGRTPKINENAGRDHWGECSSTLLAGGGIRGGQVLGASDARAAFPISDPVEPSDVQATIYHCMGLGKHTRIHDELNRPWEISTGNVLTRLLS